MFIDTDKIRYFKAFDLRIGNVFRYSWYNTTGDINLRITFTKRVEELKMTMCVFMMLVIQNIF